jgi:glucan-binding repeat-containing protein
MTEKDIVICGHGSGTPSYKNMYSYLTLRYNAKADNGLRKQIVAVRRLKGMTDDKRQLFQQYYSSIIGRNYYNQNRREYCYTPYKDGKYYSDCSSSGIKTYVKCGFSFSSTLNTAGIYNSSLFENVPVKIQNGHITNPEILKVGDALLFVGNDPKRPKQIGHVEFVFNLTNNSNTKPTTTTTTTVKQTVKYPDWVHIGTGINSKWYYREKEGVNAHGWKNINGHRYYFDEKTGLMAKDWLKINGKWYYFQPESGEGAVLAGALYVSDADGAQHILKV